MERASLREVFPPPQPSSDVFLRFDEILLMQRGGYMAYYGPLGSKGRELVHYVESIPGVRKCPRGMNPASWMLDVLAGADSSAGHHHAEHKEEGGAANGDAAAAEGPLDGQKVQDQLFGSEAWKKALVTIDAACTPKPEATAFKFSSVYARSFPQQLAVVLKRAMVSYNRNVGYQFVKIMMLFGLLTMFGTIYYKACPPLCFLSMSPPSMSLALFVHVCIACRRDVPPLPPHQIKPETDCAPATGSDKYSCVNDPGGVQSIVSVVFITALFASFISMSTVLPVMVRERAVLYRERFSFMYLPEVHALAYALAEIPWLIFLVLYDFTGLYFMLGLTASAKNYFTYMFVVWLMIYIFTGVGQWAAAHFPTAEIAQTSLGIVLPLCFLFGGLYLQKPLIPNGPNSDPSKNHPHVYWQWAYYAVGAAPPRSSLPFPIKKVSSKKVSPDNRLRPSSGPHLLRARGAGAHAVRGPDDTVKREPHAVHPGRRLRQQLSVRHPALRRRLQPPLRGRRLPRRLHFRHPVLPPSRHSRQAAHQPLTTRRSAATLASVKRSAHA